MKPMATFPGLSPNGILFCLELANNHQGSVEHGCKLIDESAAVARRTQAQVLLKLQFRDLDAILHPADRIPAANTPPLSAHSKRFRDTALSKSQFQELLTHARKLNMPVYATPFDEASVDWCVECGFNVIKVASCSAADLPLLRKIASTRLPVIASVGGLELSQIDELVDFFTSEGSSLAVLHCIAAYPTPEADLQLDCIRQFQERFPHIVIGYSGHEAPKDNEVTGWAVAKGARIIERHVGLPTEKVKLNAYSLNPQETEQFILTAQRAAAACALNQPRRPVAGEQESLLSLKRGMYARHSIPAGKTITRDDVFLSIPCLPGQFHAGKFFEVVDTFAPMRPIHANMPIGLDLPAQLPKSLLISSIAARVKEMLDQSKISLDSNVVVELSHQYGFERFFDVGAVIIDIVNRDYCKKLIVQFPNQEHPSHRHIEKEETFHVLSGTVDMVVNGKNMTLQPGNQMLVERGTYHRFSTKTGTIFEEVSTTHIKGDSEYEDKTIKSDPEYRKTRITLPL